MIPLPPWATLKLLKLVGIGVAALAAGWLLWSITVWHAKAGKLDQAVADLKACQGAVAAANKRAADADKLYADSKPATEAALALANSLLSRPQPDPKTLIVKVPTNAPVTSCPDRGPEYRVRYNEIAATGSRDP